MIGVFDSGYGGLTVLRSLTERLPQYDYLYLGDNARAPYGPRSFETVYQYTLQSVEWLFRQGCPLVILACNTASAKALRSIQQRDLPSIGGGRSVLGVIRPTTEIIGQFTRNGKIGIFATRGTVVSGSYPIEIARFYPDVQVFQQACPMWVPLIENNQHKSPGADYFVRECVEQLLGQSPEMDTILLGCTHYPLLEEKIQALVGPQIRILSQGSIVADSLADYLLRHADMEQRLGRSGKRLFFTTDDPADFDAHASLFFGRPVESRSADLMDDTHVIGG
jgi:glutamate racemase